LTPSPKVIEIPWNYQEKTNWKRFLRCFFKDLDSDEELCEVPFPFGIIFFPPQNKYQQVNALLIFNFFTLSYSHIFFSKLLL
jgi:hypothetical protein